MTSASFPKWYDFFMKPLEKKRFKRIRQDLIQKAYGNVLEIGSGTGINFCFYNDVDQVTATEPSEFMIQKSEPRIKQAGVPIRLVQASAENLPFEENTFDTVVATLVFCTIPNVEKAIAEMKRVCKPDGKILLFEHVKMENSFLATLQDRLTPVWKKICDGCYLNRETMSVIQSNDLSIIHTNEYYKGLFVSAEAVNKK
jgi:ubiquinone/menaquinone biosynthesis C-methylase UbiE